MPRARRRSRNTDPASHNGDGRRTTASVVIADDEPSVRGHIEQLLDGRHTVLGLATDGSSLLDLVARHSPDIAIVDISMPGMNGIQAARRIAESHPSTRVVILSVHDDEAYVNAALAAGAEGYVLKLMAGTELLPAIDAVLAGRSYLSAALRNGGTVESD